MDLSLLLFVVLACPLILLMGLNWNFVGLVEKPPGCITKEDCPLAETCTSGICTPVCNDPFQCRRYGSCQPDNQHSFTCLCESGYEWSSFLGTCVEASCQNNADCQSWQKCDGKCTDVCEEIICHGENEMCITSDATPHTSECTCWFNYILNPTLSKCVQKCTNTTGCMYGEACREGMCMPICTPYSCGEHEVCKDNADFTITCECETGYVTSDDLPQHCMKSCEDNTICEDSEVCANGKCTPACDVMRCDTGLWCTAIGNHATSCVACSPSQLFNNKIGSCVEKSRACTSDENCAPADTCISDVCTDVCDESLKCGLHGLCQADNQHSFSCSCELGYIRDTQFQFCTPVVVECKNNTDCEPYRKCQGDLCVDSCLGEICPGENEICASVQDPPHSFRCTTQVD